FAAGAGHTATVELLLDAGAAVDAAVAAEPEYVAQVAESLAKGEEVEAHKDGVTSLMLAALGGHVDTVRTLLARGADVRLRDDEDQSALLAAVRASHFGVAVQLLEAGADPNESWVDDKSSDVGAKSSDAGAVTHNLLADAIAAEDEDFALALLAKGTSTTHRDASGVSLLMSAAHLGMLPVAEALLVAGAEVDAANDAGATALITAAHKGHEGVVKALIAAGASLNAQDVDGSTALMAAAAGQHLETAKALAVAGADVNAQNKDGHSALMFAYHGRSQIAVLLERYAEVLRSAEEDGEGGPEDKAVSDDLVDKAVQTSQGVVDLLLASGADALLKDKEGRTAAD
ncbi:unnamed protein product, partial [Phaeothamnion confervicola]